MSVIAPSILARDREEYERQLQAIRYVAERIHIDLADGELAAQTLGPDGIVWPEGIEADIHLMYQDPLRVIDEMIALRPSLVIVHSEANDVLQAIEELQLSGIRAGLAITQKTSVESVAHIISVVDHVLVFSGSLGHFGGVADLTLLDKVKEVTVINPDVEIGWDGGANIDTIPRLQQGGIDVIVVGGAIQKADDPARAYAELQALLHSTDR